MTLLDGIKVKKELLNELKNKIDTKNIKHKYAKKEKTNLLKKICKMIKTKCG